MTPKRWILAVLSFAASIGASAYIVYTTWPQQRNPAILPLWAHGAALLLALLEMGSRALKIHFSAAALRVPLGFGATLRTCLGGDFGGAITPGRSGAEPARYLILSEAGVPPAENFLILWIELFLEMLSLAAVVVAFGILFQGSAGGALAGVLGVVGIYALFVLGLAAAGIVLSRRNASGPPPAWASALWLHAGRWRAIQRSLRRIRAGVERARDAKLGLLALAYLASILHVLFRLAILPLLVFALGGLTGSIAPLVLWPLALFYGGVVAPVPGGGGFIEVTFRHFLGDAIPAFVLGASLIWWRFYTFYLYVILGAIAAGRSVMRALRDDGEEMGEEGATPAAEGAA
ncbi:MAG TPA: flippase-like domain-containing protein [Gemmatimonadaceae bacterium]|nr:flippase-like domain-containing protein [Gemmatimonadaceae bacterium]